MKSMWATLHIGTYLIRDIEATGGELWISAVASGRYYPHITYLNTFGILSETGKLCLKIHFELLSETDVYIRKITH